MKQPPPEPQSKKPRSIMVFILYGVISFLAIWLLLVLVSDKPAPPTQNSSFAPITNFVEKTPQENWTERYKNTPDVVLKEIDTELNNGNFTFARKSLDYLEHLNDPKVKAMRKKFEKAQKQPLKNQPKKALPSNSGYNPDQVKRLALENCRNRTIGSLHFPSSFDQEILSTSTMSLAGNGAAVEMPFNAKNGFGNELPQVARCITDSFGKIIMFNVSNR